MAKRTATEAFIGPKRYARVRTALATIRELEILTDLDHFRADCYRMHSILKEHGINPRTGKKEKNNG